MNQNTHYAAMNSILARLREADLDDDTEEMEDLQNQLDEQMAWGVMNGWE